MTLPPFDIHRPATVDDATALLDRLGDDGVVYCGGTELLLVYKFGFADYSDLVDVKGIGELRGIAAANGELTIGAAETHRAIERAPDVRAGWPALAAMERHVGNVRVRAAGTIGGNLCFADPHSDPATFLLAAGGALTCRRGGGAARRIAIEDFVSGPFETALAPGELLVSVHVPRLAPGAALVHRKLSFHERPAITVAAHVRVDGGALADVRLAVGSVGLVAARARAAEGLLDGVEADAAEPAIAAAADAAAEESTPVADANGSIEYKRQLVRVLSGRCLRAAIAEALAARA